MVCPEKPAPDYAKVAFFQQTEAATELKYVRSVSSLARDGIEGEVYL